MIYPILSLGKNNNTFNYAEYEDDPEKGSFLQILDDDLSLKIKVDRFSTIPFYYAVFKNKLYGSTKLDLLIATLPDEFDVRLDILSSIEFLRTNSLMGSNTLLSGVKRIPYGTQLVFDKREGSCHLLNYWELPGEVSHHDDDKLVDMLRERFFAAIEDSIRGFDSIGMHLSGGMDSRQIFGSLLQTKRDFKCFTYGLEANLDARIAKRIARKYEIEHHYLKWENVDYFKDYFDKIFSLSDGMQAVFHGHGIDAFEREKGLVDTVIYGHFIDFYLQGHTYNPIYETDLGVVTLQKLYECFDGGPCSVMRGDSLELSMFEKEYCGAFRASIHDELAKFDYMVPEKRYDAMYFVHHGLRRLLPQVQSGAQLLDFRLPGLHRDFFEASWGVPGASRKNRGLQERLLRSINPRMLKIPVVKDNTELCYQGGNRWYGAAFRWHAKLKRGGRWPFKPDFNYYGEGLSHYANRDLFHWMKGEILQSGLLEAGFLKREYVNFLFSEGHFRPQFSLGHYGALMTLSRFYRTYCCG